MGKLLAEAVKSRRDQQPRSIEEKAKIEANTAVLNWRRSAGEAKEVNVLSDEFLHRAKRRNVYKVAVAYAVVAWLLIQAASILFPTFEAPAWVMKVVVAAIAIGFPIAPDPRLGLRADARGTATDGTWIYIVVAGGLLSGGLFFLGRYTASRAEGPPLRERFLPAKSTAVLPFASLSEGSGAAFFVKGGSGAARDKESGLPQPGGARHPARNSCVARPA